MAQPDPIDALDNPVVQDVIDDIEWLLAEWRPEPRIRALRHLSPHLRRLLVEGTYGRAWKQLGLLGEPYIAAPDLRIALGTVERSWIQVAFAPPSRGTAMAMLDGGQLQMKSPADITAGSVVVIVMPVATRLDDRGPIFAAIPSQALNGTAADPEAEARRSFGKSLGPRRVVGLPVSEYLASPSAYIGSETVTRRDVLQYVANKLGGAHSDPGRGRKGDERFLPLDTSSPIYRPSEGQAIPYAYVELLSIAEALAESTDAQRLLDAYRRAAKRQGAEPST